MTKIISLFDVSKTGVFEIIFFLENLADWLYPNFIVYFAGLVRL